MSTIRFLPFYNRNKKESRSICVTTRDDGRSVENKYFNHNYNRVKIELLSIDSGYYNKQINVEALMHE